MANPRAQRIQVGNALLYKEGTARFELSDPYHLAMTVRWPWFFAGFVGVFAVINLVFAALYALDPGAIANVQSGHPLRDAFFFSMETLATVGYGTMSPASTYGHVLSAIEIICGLAFTAIMTGLIFVRFSKVKPKMLFADRLVVCQHDGSPTLMLRLAYGRSGMLMSCDARLHVLVSKTTSEGRRFRLMRELKLSRSHMPLLVLTWTLMHTIDEHSPLHGLSAEDVRSGDVRAIVTIEARDHSLASSIFDLRSYAAEQICYGMVYQDLVSTDADTTVADVRKISLVQPE
jgi:inward rectifier potassium channel